MHHQFNEGTQTHQEFAQPITVVLFETRTDTNGALLQTTWSELRARLRSEPDVSATKDGGCFVFGRIDPDTDGRIHHKKKYVAELHALAVDFDDVPDDAFLEAHQKLAERGLEFAGWPTHSQLASARDGELRCRLVFPLSRPVPGKDWGKFWPAAIEYLGLKGLADSQCSDASRLYFHTCPPEGASAFEEFADFLSHEGAALDVEAALARVPRPAAPEIDLNAKSVVDGAVRVERCPPGGSIFEHAEKLCQTMPPAISGQGGHLALLRVARALTWGLELDHKQAFDLIEQYFNPRCEPQWSEFEIDHKLDSGSGEDGAPYRKGALLPPKTIECAALLDTDDSGTPRNTGANVTTILGLHHAWLDVLRFDAFAGRVWCSKEPPMREQDKPNGATVGEWTDAHTARARNWVCSEYGFEPGKDTTDGAVEIVARRNTFHPVREYLETLTWDGVPRLGSMLERYFGADAGVYSSTVGAKFMVSAVARAMKPGAKVDTMLILEGAQGTKKSTAVRTLAGDAWFADTPLDLESKDAAQCLQGKWIYEIGELHSFNRSETTRIKAFVSSLSDNLRPSYGRRNQDFPRQCVFIGTTNGTEYLSDTTGNCRYWPVRCGAIDVAALGRDRDQLWAEARARFEAGEPWWLDTQGEALAAAQQVEREVTDPWEAQIDEWVAGRKDDFTMVQLLVGLGVERERQTPQLASRGGKLLAKLGFARKQRRIGGARREWFYAPSPVSPAVTG